ncbi:hypothetical protein [Bradyrhizobium sp. NBAIM02]|uniref:hypothetical protein n=1 Tax=Bradyrhizobium sp. NBAIM02 TaxID=2793817 RepID=UPI001CD5CAAF|nr:hypothetical protein [Bradyrhizobium sp. NBAIM02]MCA1503810.1 hypothetical protein [Bradyrhizobium sp. NBAIM02]
MLILPLAFLIFASFDQIADGTAPRERHARRIGFDQVAVVGVRRMSLHHSRLDQQSMDQTELPAPPVAACDQMPAFAQDRDASAHHFRRECAIDRTAGRDDIPR